MSKCLILNIRSFRSDRPEVKCYLGFILVQDSISARECFLLFVLLQHHCIAIPDQFGAGKYFNGGHFVGAKTMDDLERIFV